MPLYFFYTMVHKWQKWPKTQIKGILPIYDLLFFMDRDGLSILKACRTFLIKYVPSEVTLLGIPLSHTSMCGGNTLVLTYSWWSWHPWVKVFFVFRKVLIDLNISLEVSQIAGLSKGKRGKKPCFDSGIGSCVRACVTEARATVYVCVHMPKECALRKHTYRSFFFWTAVYFTLNNVNPAKE